MVRPSYEHCCHPRSVPRPVARLPLDVASNAWLLLRRRSPPFEHRIGCGSKIGSCQWQAISRPARIELPSVSQLPFLVEQEKIRRACRPIRFCNFLGFIAQVSKRVARFPGFLLHAFDVVLWKRHRVIGVDRHHLKASRLIIPAKTRQFIANMADKRAVRTYEYNEDGGRLPQIAGGDKAPFDAGKTEPRH